MDIEGAEELALRGMSAGLMRHRYRSILLELHPEALAERGRNSHDIIELLAGRGYRGWLIDHSPSVFRQAAYARTPKPKSFLQPFDPEADLQMWPHILWLAPGLNPPT